MISISRQTFDSIFSLLRKLGFHLFVLKILSLSLILYFITEVPNFKTTENIIKSDRMH